MSSHVNMFPKYSRCDHKNCPNIWSFDHIFVTEWKSVDNRLSDYGYIFDSWSATDC